MKIVKCKTNHMTNPLGYAFGNPAVSWQVVDAKSKKQEAAQVIVAQTETMDDVIYDSGRDEYLSSLCVELPVELKPRTRYYWKVRVWGDEGELSESGSNWFETGKMGEEWKADWITADAEGKIHPLFRKAFNLQKDVMQARAYVCGLGAYELYVNGQKVGEEYLSPGCTTADEWIQSYTYDLTGLVQKGENVVGVLAGNGWLKSHRGGFEGVGKSYADNFLLLLELHITYWDGSKLLVKSDGTWQWLESWILDSSIYDGEICDFRKMVHGWCRPGVLTEKWKDVELTQPGGLGRIEDRLSLPIILHEMRRPVELIHTPAGEKVLDFGQNMAGWVRFHMSEPAGTKLSLSYGEILQDGNFYRENLRTAKAQYCCICDGNERDVEPHFTFFGFRYVKLEGFMEEISLSDFTACALYSALEETGYVETTDSLVNRLFLNTKWGQKSNFIDVPTDCPQRDERMGWTGDTQVFSGTATFHMDTYAFYHKFLHDLWYDQRSKNGMVGNVVPCFLPEKKEQSLPYHGGSAVWGDCAVILPWTLYLYYGDKSILKEQYLSMRGWVDWVSGRLNRKSGLWEGDYQWGDWLALDGPVKGGTEGGTDTTYIATAYFKHSAEILAKAATVLGKMEDREKYRHLAENAKRALCDEYFSTNGRSTINTQTAYLLALRFDLVAEGLKERVLKDFLSLILKDNKHLQTGFVGTPLLCSTLTEYGQSELAYDIFMQEDNPGWLYAVKLGATSIWERWDSVQPDGKMSDDGMNSLNHYAYGSVMEWVYSYVCGIQPLEEQPGFSKFRLCPHPDWRLYGAKAIYDSPKGTIRMGWQRSETGQMHMKLSVPFDAEAQLVLPDAANGSIIGLEGLSQEQKGTTVWATLPAGEYEIFYPLIKSYSGKYSTKDTLETLKGNPYARDVLYDSFPMIDSIPAEFFEGNKSLHQVLNGAIRLSGMVDVDELEKELNEKLGAVMKKVRNCMLEI